jgi:hypothetical protein
MADYGLRAAGTNGSTNDECRISNEGILSVLKNYEFGILSFGYCDLFGIWYLSFGIFVGF